MTNQLGYIKTNGNVVYVENGIEKIAHVGKMRIFENKSSFGTEQAKKEGLQLVDVSNIIANINTTYAANTLEKLRVESIRNKFINVVPFKLSIKEKNKIKKEVETTATEYFIGNVTVTDSSRGKGGYFKYSDTLFEGIFYNNKWKGISKYGAGEIVSSRKKNYSTNFKPIEKKEVVKILVAEIEKKETERLINEAKIHNANLMLDNLDVFRAKVFEILTK